MLMSCVNTLKGFLLRGYGTLIGIQFNGRQYFEEDSHNLIVNCLCWDILTDGHTILLTKVVADITWGLFVLNHHLVTAFTTIDHTVQQCLTTSGYAAGLIAIIGGVVLLNQGHYLFKGLPTDVGWVFILDYDLPLVYPKPFLSHFAVWTTNSPSPTIDKGSGVCWILENLKNSCYCWFLPNHIAEPVVAWKPQFILAEKAKDLGCRLQFLEHGED